MKLNEVLEAINQYGPVFLPVAQEPVNGRESYICPSCGHGEHGDGIAWNPHSQPGHPSYKCFVCGENNDAIGWYMKANNKDFKTAVNELASQNGIDPSSIEWERRPETGHPINYDSAADAQAVNPEPAQPELRSYENYFQKWAYDYQAQKANYFESRGIGADTIKKHQLGLYTDKNGNQWAVIPKSSHSYTVRNTNPQAKQRYKDSPKAQNEPATFFNQEVLTGVKPAFIVEGPLDALSAIEAGGEAVALGGVEKVKSLVKDVIRPIKEAGLTLPKLVIALDHDEPGRQATAILRQELDVLEVAYTLEKQLENTPKYKDFNELLLKDRQELANVIKHFSMEPDSPTLKAEEYIAKLEANKVSNQLENFYDNVLKYGIEPVPTGFKKLDKILEGGLYDGLHTIGAMSSLGKTALIMQIADQIATAGHDVFIFSLEMGKDELIARSISRYTYQEVLKTASEGEIQTNTGTIRNAKSAISILNKQRLEAYSPKELGILQTATDEYAKPAQHLYIHEGVGNIGTSYIRDELEKYTKYTGKRPLVIVDYLQILATPDPRLGDKQATDTNVIELKRISRDYKVPIIAISSFNRQSYKSAVSFESFKESGRQHRHAV